MSLNIEKDQENKDQSVTVITITEERACTKKDNSQELNTLSTLIKKMPIQFNLKTDRDLQTLMLFNRLDITNIKPVWPLQSSFSKRLSKK